MQQIPLGRTGLTVSDLCLGTMTWGTQTTEAEGHAQIDLALAHGINFWDTAEMYPVNPVRAETVGRTEEIIGNWIASRGGRDRIVLATKIAGGGRAAIRDGAPPSAATLRGAVEASLGRLKTDYIDLYQIHWPNRAHYHFREIWQYDPRRNDRARIEAEMLDILQAADVLVREGKIRHLGLSNETVWGAASWLRLADRHGLPRMATVQNEYSLLCRQFDSDWAEFSVMEDMPLLAFSPLAAGLLTGKYQGDVTPPGSRRSLNPDLGGRIAPRCFPAVAAYLAVARRFDLDPVALALAFCRSRPFATIPILGATTLEQLAHALAAAPLRLAPEVLAAIDAAHRAHPQPY